MQYERAGGPDGDGRADYHGLGGANAAYGGNASGRGYDDRPSQANGPQQQHGNIGDLNKDNPTANPVVDNKDSNNNMDLR
jgi:hypothetical protein